MSLGLQIGYLFLVLKLMAHLIVAVERGQLGLKRLAGVGGLGLELHHFSARRVDLVVQVFERGAVHLAGCIASSVDCTLKVPRVNGTVGNRVGELLRCLAGISNSR